ncbi:hypothetical protein TVAG_580330 [Trichomonas vaginalis G3]|uniref:Uncharacterized protein n=1 Tax=Trichomonas vaginalis (strain ATCC PRA-98 / G3) TaxID=412133 RepID=A2GKB2_TRIV3|nr:hypothetical protein TVAGG3_0154260 [Trichomonas vaginalis G3]EAX82404.1 hypothetical protein TVAG_580330 [Trichomonas vaginalis G3]KAI5547463.1 hypothetical protein TVAGG3_0154260 [Trichomonas vaginalis G3]|eukprot:XP_001295334.1 hypothetical protein [Trichomonas vaginalis G3]
MATVLRRQALDQFILLFPEDQRTEMNRKATNFEPYSLSYDPNELSREFGSHAWQCTLTIKRDKKKVSGPFPIERKGRVAIVRVIAMVAPQRVTEGKQCPL